MPRAAVDTILRKLHGQVTWTSASRTGTAPAFQLL
jgi:hypothetical protein